MRCSQAPEHLHLSQECIDACRFKLTAVLTRLSTGRLPNAVSALERFTTSPASESTTELALFCRRYLAANRMGWTSFLTRQVSDALERIDNGSYGLCLRCGESISAKRIAALPWVALCIGCQEGKSSLAQHKPGPT
jgi:DnaK suppressor protein